MSILLTVKSGRSLSWPPVLAKAQLVAMRLIQPSHSTDKICVVLDLSVRSVMFILLAEISLKFGRSRCHWQQRSLISRDSYIRSSPELHCKILQ